MHVTWWCRPTINVHRGLTLRLGAFHVLTHLILTAAQAIYKPLLSSSPPPSSLALSPLYK